MNSYNLGAMSGTYTTGFGGYNGSKPRKANDETAMSKDNKFSELSKEFKDGNFNQGAVAFTSIVGSLTGVSAGSLMGLMLEDKNLPSLLKPGSGKYTIATAFISAALTGGVSFLGEKNRSTEAQKHNEALLKKLRAEENNQQQV